jgi:hypothetical protein
LYSHSPVSSGERISSTCSCVSANSSEKALAVGMQFAAVAVQVFLGEQAFDGRRARRRGAEAALGHGFAQFLVVDQLAGAFHGGEQRGFREARRRLGLPCP